MDLGLSNAQSTEVLWHCYIVCYKLVMVPCAWHCAPNHSFKVGMGSWESHWKSPFLDSLICFSAYSTSFLGTSSRAQLVLRWDPLTLQETLCRDVGTGEMAPMNR